MKRLIVWILFLTLSFPAVAAAPRWDWPIGFSIGAGVNYEYAQEKNTDESPLDILISWRNNSLGFSAFLVMTFFMLRTDLRLGVGGEYFDYRVGTNPTGTSFSYNSVGFSAYLKFPSLFANRKVWLYFPMVGVEYSIAFGNHFSEENPRHLYDDLYVMFGLSGDFEIWQEDFFLKPSLLFGFNATPYIPGTYTGAGFKVVAGLEMGWRFKTFNKRL